ncbi:hypothetical protein SCHPADRAFT_194676 [Schizopora paradoxa]|uniref:Uncharacterized protein n=1 Tax=Schizopora paradoxa TaxID=27342 RepID=A0A0H2RYK4_9AGAM|nr:hypothetical protein SCHPADRAFT_194676 [Schizopora paradoxa]
MTRFPSQLLRRDGVVGISYVHAVMAIDILFCFGYFMLSGLCVRILMGGRGRRAPYAFLLISSLFYAVFLALDTASVSPSANITFTEGLNLSNAMVFFLDLGFTSLFFAIAGVFLKRRTIVSELAGGTEEPASVGTILLVVVGVAISSWLLISSFVQAGTNISANTLLLRIYESSFISTSTMDENERRHVQVVTAGYVVAAARCTTCIYVAFISVYTRARKYAFGHDKVGIQSLQSSSQ